MSKGELIDNHVSSQQCKVAVNALLNHVLKIQEKKSETELLPGKEQHVWLVMTVKQMYPEKKLKPSKIPIVHPLVDPRTTPVCLITKDPQREYKDLLDAHGIRFISRVVGITKLKGKFKPFEARRLLLKENGLFLADERVVPLLPKLLGRKFFEAKKQPIPVCLTRKDLKGELEHAISSTYFHQNQGTCTSVKIGTLSQNPSQVLENLETALPAIVKNVKGEWDNIQSFHIKTNSSASLPIWSCNLGGEEGARWAGLTTGATSEEESGGKSNDEDREMGTDEESNAKSAKGKGNKRAAEEEPEKPKKKARAGPIDAEAQATKDARKGKKRSGEGAGEVQKKAKADVVTNAAVSEVASKPKKADTLTQANVVKARLEKAASASGLEQAEAPMKKSKKRKSAGAELETAQPTSTGSVKAVGLSGPSMAPTDPTIHTEHKQVLTSVSLGAAATKKPRNKKAHNSAVIGPVASIAEASATAASTAPAADMSSSKPTGPATPTVADRTKARASAVDYFQDTPAQFTPTVPPNTPADGLIETPAGSAKRKGRAKGGDATPLTNAIAKLATQSTASSSSEKVDSRKDQVDTISEPSAIKKVKKRKMKATAGSDHGAAVQASSHESDGGRLIKEDVKQKRSLGGSEKKKEKVVNRKPAAKSAKDAIIGRKRP
ncbi:hypothetical protein AcW1_007276 [Taiwanofungus camphoratus]|nr:hypothetical protein AcW2_007657 [Antrodia cinnamomea]KAI0952924.1 hypothetical protein AcW1_007276 [Antrodia cinnamomea]